MTILFRHNCDGLKLTFNFDSPLQEVTNKALTLTRGGMKLMKMFMENSLIGNYKCDQIYYDNTPFSKTKQQMLKRLENGDTETFKKCFGDFKKSSKLISENREKVKQFNIVAHYFDEFVGLGRSHKLLEIPETCFDDDCKIFLEIAAERSMPEVVKFLLDQNFGVDKTEAIKTASAHGFFEILELLLAKVESVDAIKDLNILHTVCKNLHRRSEKKIFNYQACFHLLLDKFPSLVNETDNIRNIPLHYATSSRSNKDEIVKLLQNKSFLGAKNKEGRMPIDCISRNSLEEFLNSCITLRNDDQEMEIDYRFLFPANKRLIRQETFLLNEISENPKLRSLVAHPVLSSFIFLKWWKLRFLTCANFILFLLFAMTMTYFIITKRIETSLPPFCCFAVLTAVLAIREFIQFAMSGLRYFTVVSNYLEIALIIFACFALFGCHEYAAIPLFVLTGYELLNLLGTLPFLSVSIYLAILKKVLKTFGKSFLVFFIIPLTFAICFNQYYVINKLGDQSRGEANSEERFNTFQKLSISVIKVVAMMTGELGKIQNFNVHFEAKPLPFTTLSFQMHPT